MATITGFIEKIKFRNEENGYTVLSVTDQSDGDEVIMVGTLSYAAEFLQEILSLEKRSNDID